MKEIVAMAREYEATKNEINRLNDMAEELQATIIEALVKEQRSDLLKIDWKRFYMTYQR